MQVPKKLQKLFVASLFPVAFFFHATQSGFLQTPLAVAAFALCAVFMFAFVLLTNVITKEQRKVNLSLVDLLLISYIIYRFANGFLTKGGDYNFIGGNAHSNFLVNPTAFQNACAMRLSYAINMTKIYQISYESGKTMSGDVDRDGMREWYYYRVSDMYGSLEKTFGLPLSTTTNEIQGKKGIICQSSCGWGDASGHLDVWDGTNAVDHYYPECTDIYFWEIK